MLDELTITDRHLLAACEVNRFVMPWAAGSDPHRDVDWMVPAVRFPLAEYCANPNCQRMVTRDQADPNEGRCAACAPAPDSKRRWPTYQVSLVLACPDGHLAEVDWGRWLHQQPGGECSNPAVRYRAGASADRPTLYCQACRRNTNFDPEIDFPCSGAQPWLPGAGPVECGRRARPLERTSVSAYYAQQMSGLTIPVAGADDPALLHALNDNPVMRVLQKVDRTDQIVAQLAETSRRLGIPTDAETVRRHLDALAAAPRMGPSRGEELRALTSTEHPRRGSSTLPDLVVEPADVETYRGSRFGDALGGVSLVPRLRETRVLTGFSRVEPTSVDTAVGYAQLWGRERPKSFEEYSTSDWLPGYQVFGEGILLVLEPGRVERWTVKAERSQRLQRAAGPVARQGEQPRPLPWLLAHTLAHLVMRAAAPQAGYPLPSLRERIFAVDGRTALLVYTAAGDVHGTLGGLVELGSPDKLRLILESALEGAAWCATDPVCMEDSTTPRGRGTAPGACHHCLLVPETSCESFNRGLDRAAVLGVEGAPGFFD